MSVCICIYLLVISYCSAFSNLRKLDEINSVHYNVNILSVPVLKEKPSGVETVKLISKHGQEYVCDIPTIQINSADIKKMEEPFEDLIDIAELLVPMEAAPCLVKKLHWWTYEFCYASIIKQYHTEDNKVLGPILILGQYASEYNWKKNSESKNRLKNFHTQFYVNGTRCDINGKQRQTEVQFHCDDGSSDYIRQVDEPESCRYVVVIGTSRVCHHPYLKTHLNSSPYKLNCSPTLTSEQLQKYQEVQAIKKTKSEELKTKKPTENETQNEEVQSVPKLDKPGEDLNKVGADDIIDKDVAESSFPKSKKLIFTKESNPEMETEELPIHNKYPRNKLDGLFEQDYSNPGDMTRNNFMKHNLKKVLATIREEMENYRNELLKEYDDPEEHSALSFFSDNMQKVKQRVKQLSYPKTREEYDEINADIRNLLDESFIKMLSLVKSKTYRISDEVRNEMIGKIADMKKLVHQFMSVDVTLRDEKLNEIFTAAFNIINSLPLSEVHTDKVKTRLNSLETLKSEVESSFNPGDSVTSKENVRPVELQLLDAELAKGDDLTISKDGLIFQEKRKLQILKEEEMVESRKIKLEQRIKEKLKKSGLDEQTIEIQIITPAYMTDEKYPTLVALSPKDEEILIRIVNSNVEEIEELDRFHGQFENYNFNFDKFLTREEPFVINKNEIPLLSETTTSDAATTEE